MDQEEVDQEEEEVEDPEAEDLHNLHPKNVLAESSLTLPHLPYSKDKYYRLRYYNKYALSSDYPTTPLFTGTFTKTVSSTYMIG